MHQLCPQRGEWSPGILKSPSWKKGKENSWYLIKAWGSLSMLRWWVNLSMSGSAGYLPLENSAAFRTQASGCQSSLNLQGFWSYTLHQALKAGSGWFSGWGRSPANPNSHQVMFSIHHQHFFSLYNDFWRALGVLETWVCACSVLFLVPCLVATVRGLMTQSQKLTGAA